jgi:RimJ/RimL family protein N-acetyltransferase
MRQPPILTQRLELHHIDAPHLITLLEARDDLPAIRGIDVQNPHRVLIRSTGPLHWRVPQVKKDPSVNKWFVRWIVLRENRNIIGSMSFHGPPDENGMMEIGLGIEPIYQNMGFAKEALLAMWQWALQYPQVKRLRYTVSPTNASSVALIRYFQFPLIGSQIDEIDGLEEVYEIDRERFTSLWLSS